MALHKIGLKGDCGCNYCLKCANEKTLLNSHDDSDHAVMKTVAKSELALTTDAEALASFNRLRDRKDKVSVAEFEQWEQCTGWSCSAFGILSHTQLHKGWPLARQCPVPCCTSSCKGTYALQTMHP